MRWGFCNGLVRAVTPAQQKPLGISGGRRTDAAAAGGAVLIGRQTVGDEPMRRPPMGWR